MFETRRFIFTASLFPFLGGVFCFWVGYEVIVQSGLSASAPVLVALVLGIPLMIVARLRSHSAFFKQRAIAYASID